MLMYDLNRVSEYNAYYSGHRPGDVLRMYAAVRDLHNQVWIQPGSAAFLR